MGLGTVEASWIYGCQQGLASMLDCPHCGGSVGEESCRGCQRNILHYECSRCKGIVPNPRFASGIACEHCGSQVFEDPQKQTRQYHRYYVCQECEKPTRNLKFLRDNSCAGCRARTCNNCGEYTAWSPVLDYELCIACGSKFPLG